MNSPVRASERRESLNSTSNSVGAKLKAGVGLTQLRTEQRARTLSVTTAEATGILYIPNHEQNSEFSDVLNSAQIKRA